MYPTMYITIHVHLSEVTTCVNTSCITIKHKLEIIKRSDFKVTKKISFFNIHTYQLTMLYV